MNEHATECQARQNEILLAASGELSAGLTGRLAAHCRTCPACHAFATDLDRIVVAARTLAVAGPSPAVLAAIHEAALARPRRIAFPARVRVLVAVAATLAVAAGIALHRPAAGRHAAGAASAAHMAALAWVLDTQERNGTAYPQAAAERGNHEDDALGELARQLLDLQGFDEDLIDEEALFPELPSTDLQSRSTSGIPDRRCV